MSKKKGQILIVCLWVLAILAVLAVSLGHRAAMGIKNGQYQIDKLRAFTLARSGVNAAIERTMVESLSTGTLTGNVTEGDDSGEFGIFGEEMKININKAPGKLLVDLFHIVGILDDSLAINICAWRGDQGIPVPDYRDAGHVNKGAPFTSLEELALVKGVDQVTYERLKEHLTVWGDGLVNVNTASKVVLDSLIAYCRNQTPFGYDVSHDLTERIMRIRPVRSSGELTAKLQEQQDLGTADIDVLGQLEALVDVRSAYIHIFSTGKIAQGGVSSTIECVMNRGKGRPVYWHEN